jgi:hypothetical protein
MNKKVKQQREAFMAFTVHILKKSRERVSYQVRIRIRNTALDCFSSAFKLPVSVYSLSSSVPLLAGFLID